MARGFRILHLADSHIGADLPARPRSARRRRGDDIVASYRRVLALAGSADVDVVIHAGDVFDLPAPNNAALTAAAAPLLEIAAAGVPVVIVPGNHERAVLPESLLFSHPNLHVAREPCTLTFSLRGTRVAIAAVPCIRRQAAQRFAEALGSTGWQRARADVNVLVAHQTFESARCGPAGYCFRSGDDIVEREAVPAGFDYVAAGHIHRHQVLATPHEAGPPIVYAGSPDRISFAERDEPKGAVLIEPDGCCLTHRFVEHVVRPMLVVPMNVSGCARRGIREQALERIAALPAEAVALLRLSGETTRSELRGLDLMRRARAARPDVLLTVSSQAIELVPQRRIAPAATRPAASVFAQLDAPPGDAITRPVSETRLLPAACGTYALYDKLDRLLYVGKAKSLRTRVRAHVAARANGSHFAGWTRQIARAEVRRAYSDLEALLVEADLIRKLRPPFNRQMRLWSRYCYVCGNGDPYGQLHVTRDPVGGGVCFGPYRSRAMARQVLEASAGPFQLASCPPDRNGRQSGRRLQSSEATKLCQRYFAGLCAGPCAGRVSDREYRERIEQRDAILAGVDDATLAVHEHRLEAAGHSKSRGKTLSERKRHLETLRSAFARAAGLRRAEALLGGLLLLPGPENMRTVVALTTRGIWLDNLSDDQAQAERILARFRENLRNAFRHVTRRLPKAVADSLCTVEQRMRRDTDARVFIAPAAATTLTANGLLASAGS